MPSFQQVKGKTPPSKTKGQGLTPSDFTLIDPEKPLPKMDPMGLFSGQPSYILASADFDLFEFCIREKTLLDPRAISSKEGETLYLAGTDCKDSVWLALGELKWYPLEGGLTLNGHPVLCGDDYLKHEGLL